MAVAEQQNLYWLLYKGYKNLGPAKSQVLVSQSLRIPTVHPLAVYARSETDCFYWADAEQRLYMAGIGTACHLCGEGEKRFEEVDTARKAILQDSILDVPSFTPCTGPVFLGGFSFDPRQEKSEWWQGFSDGELHLPAYLVTEIDGQTWLTTNMIVTEETKVSVLHAQVLREQEQLLATGNDPFVVEKTPAEGKVYAKEVAPERWKSLVSEAAQRIRENKYDKVVLTRQLQLSADDVLQSAAVVQRLITEQPYSYVFAVTKDSASFVGATPERLVTQKNQQIQSACLASSVERGDTIAADQAFGDWLLNDEKNRHEHQLVVDMIRTAIEQVCTDVQVPAEPVLYKMKDIQHLYTPVTGTAIRGSSLLKVVEQLHPTPALGGYPKQDAMRVIRETEDYERGWYGSPIGWIDYKDDGEFAVAIRSGLLRNKQATLFAGSGIVGDSDPDSEYQETRIKFRPMLSALGGRYDGS